MAPIFWAPDQFLLLPLALGDFSLYPSLLLVPETLTQATCVVNKEIDKD